MIHTIELKMIKKLLAVGVCTTSLLLATAAYAQQPPSSAEPDVIIRETGRERIQPPSPADVISLPEIKAGASGAATQKIFTLKRIILEGGTIYSQKEINAIAGSTLGEMASFSDLNEIARRLTLKYREDGYMFSRVVLTPQTVEDGTVHFKAIEGRITEVTVTGDYDDHFDLIERIANKIKSEGPGNTEELERYLLLIDDLPGITARSLLRPSKTQGGGELVITIEQDDVEGSLGIDNRGSRFLGQHRGTAVAAFNSLFNMHDRTTLRWINSLYMNQNEELHFLDATHEQQLGSNGLRLTGRGAVTSTHPGAFLKDQNIDGASQLLELGLMYPLIRSRDFNINLLGGLHSLNSQSEVADISVSKDSVRSITAGARIDFFDSLGGINQFDFEIAKGLSILNATSDGAGRSRTNGKHTFLRTNLTATRIQDLGWDNWSAYGSISGQLSRDALLASEEFSVGGPIYGRAYDSGEIAGDHGLAGVIELRYGEAVTNYDWLRSYQFFGFYDIGAVWNKGNVVAEQRRESLASAGAGVRFNLIHDMSGSVELSKPLTRDVNAEGTNGDHMRLFFSLLKRF